MLPVDAREKLSCDLGRHPIRVLAFRTNTRLGQSSARVPFMSAARTLKSS